MRKQRLIWVWMMAFCLAGPSVFAVTRTVTSEATLQDAEDNQADGDVIEFAASSIGGLSEVYTFSKDLTFRLASGVSSCTLTFTGTGRLAVTAESGGTTQTWSGPLTLVGSGGEAEAFLMTANAGDLTITVSMVTITDWGTDTSDNFGSGFTLSVTGAARVGTATIQHCSVTNVDDDGYEVLSNQVDSQATMNVVGCTWTTGGAADDEDDALELNGNPVYTTGFKKIIVSGGTFQGNIGGEFSDSSATEDSTLLQVTGATFNMDEAATDFYFMDSTSSLAKFTNCTFNVTEGARLFDKDTTAGGEAEFYACTFNISADGASSAGGFFDDINILAYDTTFTFTDEYDATNIWAGNGNFTAYRCVFDFSAVTYTASKQEIFANASGILTLQGCLLLGGTGGSGHTIYCVRMDSGTGHSVRNCTIIGAGVTTSNPNYRLLRQSTDNGAEIYGNVFARGGQCINVSADLDYVTSTDNCGYNIFYEDDTIDGWQCEDPVGGGGTPAILGTDDDTAMPGFVDKAGGDYRISASGAAELFVDQGSFDNSAFQIESFLFHVVGDHTNFDLSPDIYGWNETNAKYATTPDAEPEDSGTGAVNAGAYNYRGAKRSVIWTANRTWTVYGNNYTGRRR